ncbi:MAG: 4Fe-4S binding protein [Hyphomicrobiaceae bacterium]
MNRPMPPRKLLVCNCQGSMEIDGKALARALGAGEPLPVARELCRSQMALFEQAVLGGEPLLVACTQEAPLFDELATPPDDDQAAPDITYTNIRERAGWCADKSKALPKMAALLAEAAVPGRPTGLMTLKSEGVTLVYGSGQVALDAARELSRRLSVSLLLSDSDEALPPAIMTVPIHKGRIRKASGHLGAFAIEVDGYAPVLPSSRGTLEFAMARDGARSDCDLILDLSGGAPLVSGHEHRDGYLRADPASPVAVAQALLRISDLVGEFEKPLYVGYDAGICAHSRSGRPGCNRCLDVCPTGAISPDGDGVTIKSSICGGCGNCSAVCPTGAVSYAYPTRQDALQRLDVMLSTYLAAGGSAPVLLVHDAGSGGDTIGALARYGDGLPVNVLPLSLHSVFQVGHEVMLSALVAGFEHVVVLAPANRAEDMPSLTEAAALTQAFLTAMGTADRRLHVVETADPDVLAEALTGLSRVSALARRRLPQLDNKREIARWALSALNEAAATPQTVAPLPSGSPYGRTLIDTESCTLCLACVGACPANALRDNPERPQLTFTEAACVQCGICVATCPEKAIALEPRYDFTPAALSPVHVKSEEPFACIRCSKPFGTKSAIERVVQKLEGKHWMFAGTAQSKLIQMCDTCRVVTLAEEGSDPFTSGKRPRIRTTDDYAAAEEQARKTGRKPEDFLDD